MTPDHIAEIDRRHIWHPYSSALNTPDHYQVVSAHGVRLTLSDGRTLIDGMSSWWSVIHGYNHPRLNAALIHQADDVAHVMFGGLTHQPAAALCEKLVNLTPAPLQRVFLADSGSVSVEVAMKMAIQYWQSVGKPDKKRFLALRNGYHGDTFGAMSVCDPVTGMHHLFNGVLMDQLFAESPQCRFDEACRPEHLSDIRSLLNSHHGELAAVILEPIVQGTGGMRFYSPDYLKQVRKLCDDHGVLLIADEIATGFGRTGKLFACEWAGISPDIMCLGKTLTAGYMTLAATLCTDEIAEGISRGEAGVFMHGPTFMGNPLACAVANTNIDLLLESDWQGDIERIETGLRQGLEEARSLPGTVDVRVLGAIGVIERQEPVDMQTITPAFVENGVWVRPFGRLVYLMPPYVINDQDLQQLCAGTLNVLKNLAS
ncbi:MAG: adenosylmethionine--8-amino-7-oxononanoate transaminase [Porticoccaceae bacterium]|nr:adenosylmethionine--8-amino-7-oxononanoate transaminase [Porticoccaceae bacterium]